MRSYRVTALLLALIIILSACAEAADEIVPEYDPNENDPDKDLLGYEFIMAAITHGAAYPLNPTSGNTSRGDKLLQRYRETEQKFNCRIRIIDGCDLGTFLTYYAADMRYADLMFTMINSVTIGKYIQNGYFIPFSDMELDLESGLYGTPGSLEAGKFKDDYYGIIAYYWGFPAADTVPTMWINPRVLAAFQQPSPHELDEQGKWTWATLENICEAVRENTSDPEPDMRTYAFAYTSEPYLELAALYSNGARIVSKSDDGRLVYSFNSYKTLEAMEYVRSLAERDLICDGGDRQNITPFVENRRAFFFEYTHLGLSDEGATNLGYRMQDAYEWIYFPEGPSYKGEPRTAYSYWSRLFFAPLNTDTDVQSILLPYMFQPLPGETVETWQDEFRRTTFFTEESFEYFQHLRDDAFFDYLAYSSYGSEFQGKLCRMTRGTLSIKETLEEAEDKMQSALDRFYNDYLDD